jgi:hypothetical protein
MEKLTRQVRKGLHHMPYRDRERKMEHQREYQRGWYQKHKEKFATRREQHEFAILQWFRQHKSTLHCEECGINHRAVLQFHHGNKAEKRMAVSDLVSRAGSLKQIIYEIKKCDVLCVNCHIKRPWRETHETASWEEILLIED